MLTLGSLFSGIGAMDLGLERSGLAQTVWQVEQNEYCLRVLARHWPNATRHNDVRTVGKANLPRVNVIAGGFPCTDISTANQTARGLDGARSGLWFEYRRIIEEMRPDAAIIENVAALRTRGLSVVLGNVRDLGYRTAVLPISALDVGATHRRERLFVAAWRPLEHADRERLARLWQHATVDDSEGRSAARHAPAADPDVGGGRYVAEQPRIFGSADGFAAGVDRVRRRGYRWPMRQGFEQHEWEPPRVLACVPHRRERLTAIGNAVCPQVAEAVGYYLMDRLLEAA